VAIAILVSPTLSASHAVYAEQLVVYFVHICQQLYDDEFWCRITQVFLAKKLLNGCSSSSSLFACAAYSCVHSNNVHSVQWWPQHPEVRITTMLDKLKFTASPDYLTAVTTLVAMFWTFDINKVSKELTRTITFLAGHVCKLKAFKTTPALQKFWIPFILTDTANSSC